MVKGFYQLLIFLPKTTSIVIGKKGRFKFLEGYYIYTGSGRSGLEKRVKRHLKNKKKHFWHIDYFLDHAKVLQVFLFPNGRWDECSLAQKTLKRKGAEVIVPRFGASDCRCPTHLVFLGRSMNSFLTIPKVPSLNIERSEIHRKEGTLRWLIRFDHPLIPSLNKEGRQGWLIEYDLWWRI